MRCRYALQGALPITKLNCFGYMSQLRLGQSAPYALRSEFHHTALASPPEEAVSSRVYRYVIGRDPMPTPLDLSQLHDPFSTRILSHPSPLPFNLKTLLETFDSFVSEKKFFHISEDGQFPLSETTQRLNRTFRLAIWLKVDDVSVFISTSKNIESESTFLQVMAWDRHQSGFNFYLRRNRHWFFAGNSRDALQQDTRGRGPFSGHVNGSPVMKELEQPWSHWHSSDSKIGDSIFESDDPFLKTDLFRQRANADEFELLIRTDIRIWNKARVAELTGQLQNEQPYIQPIHFMRQILDNPTINLSSSKQVSLNVQEERSFILPKNFFINENALRMVGISNRSPELKVKGSLYLKNLQEYEFHLADNEEVVRFGDTHFAFLVPVTAAEDIDLLGKLITKQMVEKQFAASLLMVDFPNAIYSLKRKTLLQYVPTSMTSAAELTQKFLSAIMQSDNINSPGSAEHEFLENWNMAQQDHWQTTFQERIELYLTKVQQAIDTQEGYNDIVLLSEYRRFLVRQQPIFEFPLTLATTNFTNMVRPVAMTEDANIIDTSLFKLEIDNLSASMEL